LVNTLSGHGSVVRDITWNMDESFLVSGDKGGKLIVWSQR